MHKGGVRVGVQTPTLMLPPRLLTSHGHQDVSREEGNLLYLRVANEVPYKSLRNKFSMLDKNKMLSLILMHHKKGSEAIMLPSLSITSVCFSVHLSDTGIIPILTMVEPISTWK